MKWEKKSLIIQPQKDLWWMKSHAMVPTVDHISDDHFRIYFSGRDNKNRSLIGYANAQISNGNITIIDYSKDPVLFLGELGTFDDNGVTPSCIINYNQKKYLYYIGWNSGSTTRMSLIAGLALSTDGGLSFSRYSRGPLLERTDREPFSILTGPFVLKDEKSWKLYYVSCEGWEDADLPTYNIKYAESIDGINWIRDAHVCINFKDENEKALARPCVIKEKNIYKMWFSFKNSTIGYRMGYAESIDGKNWIRNDNMANIDISPNSWDSEMLEYPFVFNHKKIKYMLYNGNGYGIYGAGYAILKD